jgi:hypothetical protein
LERKRNVETELKRLRSEGQWGVSGELITMDASKQS